VNTYFAASNDGGELFYVGHRNDVGSSRIFDYGSNSSRNITTLADGDTVCFAIDNVNQKWWVRINDGDWGDVVNTTGDPATNTNGTSLGSYTASALTAQTSKGHWDVGLRTNTSTYAPPSGFTYLDGSDPSIVAPVFGSNWSTTYGSRTNTTITAPSDITDNDILIATLFVGRYTSNGGAVSVTPPSGWTLVDYTSVVDASGDVFAGRMYVYWKRASSESGDYTFGHPSAFSQGIISRYSGCATSGSPIDVYSKAQMSAPGSTTTTAPSITTTASKDLLVWLSHDWEGTGSISPPAGFTERSDSLVYTADMVQVTAGASNSKSQLNGNVSEGNPWGVIMLALKAGPPTVAADLGWDATRSDGAETLSTYQGVTEARYYSNNAMGGVSATTDVNWIPSSGKFYFEVDFFKFPTDHRNYFNLYSSTSSDNFYFDLYTPTGAVVMYPINEGPVYSFSGVTWTATSTLDIAIDQTAGKIWFRINNLGWFDQYRGCRTRLCLARV
jgi:hypothetical protein